MPNETYHHRTKYSPRTPQENESTSRNFSISRRLWSLQTARLQYCAVIKNMRICKILVQRHFKSDTLEPYARMCRCQWSIQAPANNSYVLSMSLSDIYRHTYLTRSFNFNNIKSLRGTLRRISNTDMSKPSRCTTAFRMASISSSDCGIMSTRLLGLLNVTSSGSSSHAPSSPARPENRMRCHSQWLNV